MTRIELVERLEQTYQWLEQFQECHAAQLSHTDREWLHRSLHEVARYQAELSSPWCEGNIAQESQRIVQRWQTLVRRGIVQQWRMTVCRTMQYLVQLLRTTVQQARDSTRAVISLARAPRRRGLRQGLVPICAFCQQIRDERGAWQRLEAYLQAHFEVQFTHDFCPPCTQRHYGITLPDEADGGEKPQRNQPNAVRSHALTGVPHAGIS